jgi:hypothetical protein
LVGFAVSYAWRLLLLVKDDGFWWKRISSPAE